MATLVDYIKCNYRHDLVRQIATHTQEVDKFRLISISIGKENKREIVWRPSGFRPDSEKFVQLLLHGNEKAKTLLFEQVCLGDSV